MDSYQKIEEVKKYIKSARLAGKSIGFVPTMGALHEGHISLIEAAKTQNDFVVCSIFVNPTQFDNPDDLKKYPRTFEEDAQLLAAANCDLIFAPNAEEMYLQVPKLSLNFGNLEKVMEGRFRTGHFNGVGIVVAKLFNIVLPDRAYFGLKDLQQVAVINRLIKDLSFDVELVPCPIIREKNGLAMSSRNRRLSVIGREQAAQIHISLKKGKGLLQQGASSVEVKSAIQTHFEAFPEFRLEYYEISDFENLEPLSSKNKLGKTAICIAAYLEGVRLIDNIVF